MAGDHQNPDLVFLHLSDIHFRKDRMGDAHDEDSMLRNELERDLRRLRTKLSRIDGVLVSGDIAFGGKKDEYTYARGWLRTVCEILGCETNAVLVTPGNHDVNREVVPRDADIDLIHQEVRSPGSLAEKDEVLANVLRDAEKGKRLLAPIAAYNSFAKEFGCKVTREKPYWVKNYVLGDATVFRLWGLTTTLISGTRDDIHTHPLMYGASQRSILREDNVRNAIMGHHPPSWTIEGDVAAQSFSTLTAMQLFGHLHDHWIVRVGNSVRVIAGAVHPSRTEPGWLPRYGAIAVAALNGHQLGIRVYLRRWSTEYLSFIPDFNAQAEDFRDYTVDVEPRQ